MTIASQAPPFWRIVWIETRMDILRTIRQPAYILPTVLLPALFFVLFAVILPNGGGAAMMLATFGVYGATGPGLFGAGVAVATDRERQILDLKRAVPMPASVYLLAKMVTILLTAIAIILLLHLLAQLTTNIALSPGDTLGLAAFQVLAAIPFAFMGVIIGMLASAQTASAFVNFLFPLLAILGGLWIPISAFPAEFLLIAWLLPTFHFGELAMGFVRGDDWSVQVPHIVVAVTMSILLFIGGIASVRRRITSR
ncbi:MAG: ABC transporter permease [Rhodocyclaceae bacterium]|nr:ABC transporter permease [Rhodocyclaceae bacterium]